MELSDGQRPEPGGTELAVAGSFLHRGHRLVFESYGRGGRVLVYLHGLLLDSGINRTLARSLAGAGFRVVLLDLLGHGSSDRPTHASEYRMDLYADQVLALLDELGLDRVVLGGVSLGANVSLMVAARAPERVAGLVLEMPVLEWAVPSAALMFVPALLALHYAAPVVRVGSFLARLVPRTSSDALNSVLAAASLSPESSAAVLHGILVGPVAPTSEQRSAIAAPTLVLGHKADLLHPFNDASNLVRQMPDCRLVRSRSLLELRLRPERLTNELAVFLETLWAGPSPARTGLERRDAG